MQRNCIGYGFTWVYKVCKCKKASAISAYARCVKVVSVAAGCWQLSLSHLLRRECAFRFEINNFIIRYRSIQNDNMSDYSSTRLATWLRLKCDRPTTACQPDSPGRHFYSPRSERWHFFVVRSAEPMKDKDPARPATHQKSRHFHSMGRKRANFSYICIFFGCVATQKRWRVEKCAVWWLSLPLVYLTGCKGSRPSDSLRGMPPPSPRCSCRKTEKKCTHKNLPWCGGNYHQWGCEF